MNSPLSEKPRLGPIIIGVNNIEKIKEFYIKVFEIEIDHQSENYLSAHLGDAHIELEEDSPHRFPHWKEHNVGTYKNSEFFVPNMSRFIEKVLRYGGRVVGLPSKKPWGSITAEIADPDGNIFLISQERVNEEDKHILKMTDIHLQKHRNKKMNLKELDRLCDM